MLFGKINPVAKIVRQSTPFNQQTIDAEWIGAIARPYALGATKVNFQVTYGNLKKDVEGNVVGFDNLFNDNVVLEGDIIANWGNNDAVILDAIALQQGTEVVETINIDSQLF